MAYATAYQYALTHEQTLYVGGQGLMTVITLKTESKTGSSQQQQQSSSQFSTGKWTAVPLLYQVGNSVVVVISTISETYYLRVQGNQIQMTVGSLDPQLEAQIARSQAITLQPAESMPTVEMPSMPEMQPMKMSGMPSMQPMQLKMGNMEMSMGNASASASEHSASSSASSRSSASSTSDSATSKPSNSSAQANAASTTSEHAQVRRFCSQCGAAVQPEDNFCAYCGNQLA